MEYNIDFKLQTLLEVLLVILPWLTITSLVLIVFKNLYFKIRRQFPINVNCWFCNQWSKVSYDDYNSFICLHCEQYNGFNKDGDYNRLLPEFSDELLNTKKTAYRKTATSNTINGLCQFCNNNQQLKIYQLANFIPLYEENYDIEIEHFQKQLEKAYKLCPQCDQTLNSTIRKQNSLLGLNISNMKRKGIIPLDVNNYSNMSKPVKFELCLKLLQLSLMILALLQTVLVCKDLFKHTTPATFLSLVLERCLNYYNSLQDNFNNLIKQTEIPHFLLKIYSLELPITTRLPFKFHSVKYLINNINAASVLINGFVLQLTLFLWKIKRNIVSLLNILAWTVLIILTIYSLQSLPVDCIKVLISLVLLTSYIKNCENRNVKRYKPTQFKKLNKSVDKMSNYEDVDLHENKSSWNSTLNQSFRGIEKQSSPQMFNGKGPTHSSPKFNIGASPKTSQFIPKSLSPEGLFSNKFSPSKSPFSSPIKSNHFIGSDLNVGLNNLTLGNSAFINRNISSPFTCKKDYTLNSFSINANVPRPKPIISPSKFQNPTQNSWVAGGFWHNEDLSNKFATPPSRCSSQSSGFCSRDSATEKAYYSPPSSMNNSVCNEYERCSVAPEPTFQLTSATNNSFTKTFEFQRNRFNEWKPYYETKSPEGQLNISLGRRAEPVMISESLYRTMPVNCSFPHFEHVYTNYYSGKPVGLKDNVLQDNSMMFQKNSCNDFITNSPIQSRVTNKQTYF